jgi:hypothetical protein
MGSVVIAVLGISGYVLPVPSLIWGWVAWWKSRPRLNSLTWRYVVAFLGLGVASAVGLSVLLVTAHVNGMPESQARYSFAMKSSARGFTASVCALLLSLLGKGPVRLPAALGSFGLAALWLVAALCY